MISFQKQSLVNKLKIQIAITIIFALLLGGAGIYGTYSMNEMVHTMYSDQLEPLLETSKANIWFMEYSYSVVDYVCQTDKSKMAVISEELTENEKNMMKEVDLFRKSDLSSEDLTIINKFDSSWKDYKTSSKEVMALAAEGKSEAATQKLDSETKQLMEEVNTVLDSLMSINEKDAEAEFASSQELFTTIRNLCVLALIVSIILICLIFYLVSTRLNEQLTLLFKGMSEIGKGNLEYRIHMDGDDELARVSGTFDDMTAIINNVSTDIQNIANDAGNGNLSRRINTGEYKGDFLGMVSRINELINAIVMPLHEAMKLANSYASSDFTPRFSDSISVKGEFQTFKDSMNQVGVQLSLAIKGVKNEIEVLTSGMEETAASMEEIAGSVSVVADGAGKVSMYSNQSLDGVKQSLVALDELSKTVGAIASKSEMASATAMKTVDLSARGKTLANQADESMSEIMKSVSATEAMVNDISEQMEEIGKIVFLISRIADQTSLLALNAAIEAARAGEAGLGFAVVADEVKDLAQDSQDSTEDIAEIIGNLQKKITEVTEAMKKSSKEVYTGNEAVSETLVLFNQIVDEIEDIHQQMGDIAGGTEEQAAATEEITASVHELGSLVEKASDEAAGSAASTEEVSGAVNQVNKVVNDSALAIQRISNEMDKFIV